MSPGKTVPSKMIPGEVIPADGEITLNERAETISIAVANT